MVLPRRMLLPTVIILPPPSPSLPSPPLSFHPLPLPSPLLSSPPLQMLHWVQRHMSAGAKKDHLAELLAGGPYKVRFLHYDWTLNSV